MLGGQNQPEREGREEVENGRSNGGRYENGIREIGKARKAEKKGGVNE